MTLAISHEENGVQILDCIREVKAPFQPTEVVAEFCAILKSYRLQSVTGDRYASRWPQEQFEQRGIAYRVSELSKSEIYLNFLPLLNSGKVELLDNERFRKDLQGHIPEHLIRLTHDGMELSYLLDTSRPDTAGECPVVALGPGVNLIEVAPSFLDFVRRYGSGGFDLT